MLSDRQLVSMLYRYSCCYWSLPIMYCDPDSICFIVNTSGMVSV